MNIGAIYYTDNRIENSPIINICREQIRKSFNGEIISVSLKPINFGRNIVLKDEVRSYPTMVRQIILALENSTSEYVFYLEHDILYHKSHFDFVPPRDDIYYYNVNNWRWGFGNDWAISYSGLTSLSSLCCNRETAINHYKYRLKLINRWGLDKIRSREPRWARKFGYEPGTKKRKNGGVTNEEHIKRKSEFPNVDIRHRWTFSKPKITLNSFIHKPSDWTEIKIDDIPGWNLKEIFNL